CITSYLSVQRPLFKRAESLGILTINQTQNMSSTSHHHGGGSIPVMAITAIFILLGIFVPGGLGVVEPFLVLGLMLLLGLPHGATDHGLFQALNKSDGGKKINFYLAYFLVIAAYGLIWWLLPLVAFGIFMLLSVYHFGQSNWVNVDHGNGTFARLHYVLWGIGILLTPILLYASEARAIVAAMTGISLGVAPELTDVYNFVGITAGLNAIVICFLRWEKRISTGKLVREFIAYGLLIALFFTNSLLLGFTVYFVFWHSLASAKDQLQFFKKRLSPALRKQLLGEISMTVLGALVFCLIVWFGPGPEIALRPSIIGGVFVFISLLTLPHMLLVEMLYTSWSPAEAKTKVTDTVHQKKSLIVNRRPQPAKESAG
ncbi:MAG: Brp/Blh family beta-carotene 15,15'-dioxygenase, partial [Bacteroidota bacterium]